MLIMAAAGGAQFYGVYNSWDASRRSANYAQDSAAAAAKQTQYNAENQNAILVNQAKQEKLNRAAAAEEESRATRHRRAAIEAMYAKGGVLMEGTPEYMLTEQAKVDIMGIDQRNLESMQRQRAALYAGQATLITGKFNAQTMISQGSAQAMSYKAQGRAAIISGVGSMLSTGASAYGSFSAPTAPTAGGAGTADYGTRTAPTNAAGPAASNYNWSPSTTTSGGYSY